jgi:hypothetical protein
MIKGINGQPYINMEEHIDMNYFTELQPELLRGFAQARMHAKEGTWMRPGFTYDKMSYIVNWKPIHKALEEFLSLPDDDPIKRGGWGLYSNINGPADYHNRNIFTRYLKMAMGAYDPYIYYFLWEEGSWDDRPGERKQTDEAKYFPDTVKWIESMQGTIFESIGRVIVFHCEHDGMPFEHRDLGEHNGVWEHNEYSPHRNEFIHIRPNTLKPFYIWDPDMKNKTYINSRAAWWNDQDWHGGDKVIQQSYSLRIDGKFTEEFRKKLGIDHIDSY